MIKILFVCHGNICRSTMAQFVFQDMVNKAGLSGNFHIDSAATSREEIGNPPHHGTVRKMKEVGIPGISVIFLASSGMETRKEKWPGFWTLHPGRARTSQIPGIQAILTSPTGM